jgi:hypothetical protein
MSLQAHIEPLNGPLPKIAWRWDAETDILSGGFKTTRKGAGLTGSVELTDEVGSIAVLDVVSGVICGLDVVVWPEVELVTGLRVPAQLTTGRVVIPARDPSAEISSLEIDTTISAEADGRDSIFHLRVGAPRPVEVVRVAEQLYIEVDQERGLAGFWLTEVPPFPELEDGE